MRKKLLRLVLGICALAAFTSCGGEKAGGTGELATVFVNATAPNITLNSDVANWFDVNNASVAACTPGSIIKTTTDTATFNVTSTVYIPPNTGSTTSITPSPVSIETVTVTLIPADTLTPELPDGFKIRNPPAGGTINPGATVPVTVEVAGSALKEFLVNSFGSRSITCSNQVTYTYRAVVSFKVIENTTNREDTVTATGYLAIEFKDVPD
ncbi:hypothetical protein [Geoanaerobacter pelophilus]|uniref:hypothetical protein n=1 Tax=Geoanaerobacter pelophilus TaxID=60036 RepID=UPI000A272719|nr:hypothetical protein [Geoanaerobacter pelophilus]